MLVGDLAGRRRADRCEPAQRRLEPLRCDRAHFTFSPAAMTVRRGRNDDVELAWSFLERAADLRRERGTAEGLVRHHQVAAHRSLLPPTFSFGIRLARAPDKRRAATTMPRGGVA